jgi:hypothetical protein
MNSLNNDPVSPQLYCLGQDYEWQDFLYIMNSQPTYMPYDVPTLIAAGSIILLLYYLLGDLFSPLRDIKGPILTRYTRLWELYKNWQGQLEHVTVALHKQYGMSIHATQIRILILDRPYSPVSTESLQHQRPDCNPYHLWPRVKVQQIRLLHPLRCAFYGPQGCLFRDNQ